MRLASAFALVAASAAIAAERSPALRAEFVRLNPCPSTGATRGPCPGWQVDHVEALVCGGRDELRNLQWIPAGIGISTWFIGIVMGYRLGIRAARRLEYNAAAAEIRALLIEVRQSSVFSARLPSEVQWDVLSHYLGRRQRQKVMSAVRALKHATAQRGSYDPRTGTVDSGIDHGAIDAAIDELLRLIPLR